MSNKQPNTKLISIISAVIISILTITGGFITIWNQLKASIQEGARIEQTLKKVVSENEEQWELVKEHDLSIQKASELFNGLVETLKQEKSKYDERLLSNLNQVNMKHNQDMDLYNEKLKSLKENFIEETDWLYDVKATQEGLTLVNKKVDENTRRVQRLESLHMEYHD